MTQEHLVEMKMTRKKLNGSRALEDHITADRNSNSVSGNQCTMKKCQEKKSKCKTSINSTIHQLDEA